MKTHKHTTRRKAAALLLGLGLTAPAMSFAQDTIYPVIHPTESRGYTAWEDISGCSYSVEVYQKDLSSNTYALISTVLTNASYAHLDPLIFTLPNMYFRVKAIKNGNVRALSDYVPNPHEVPVGGAQEYETLCNKWCNGRTYAWHMEAYAPRNYTGEIVNGVAVYSLGNTRLRYSNTYQYYNNITGDYTPFWQAIGTAVWDSEIAYPDDHPYKTDIQGANQFGTYWKISFDNNNSTVSYLDANNNFVSDGELVEKKLDQYHFFNGENTVEAADAGTNLCADNGSAGLGIAWIGFYNNHVNPPNIPYSVLPFSNTVPTGVACLGAWTAPDAWEENDWNEWYENLYAEVKEMEEAVELIATGGTLTWGDLTDQVARLVPITAPNDAVVDGVSLTSVTDPANSVSFKLTGEGKYLLTNSTGSITKGIYQLAMLTSDANAVTSVLKISSDLPVVKDKDFVELAVAPNPVEDNTLAFYILPARGLSAQVFVHNLNGEQILSEAVNLVRNQRYSKELDLSNIATPMNQLRVTVVFSDGSALQETALVTN